LDTLARSQSFLQSVKLMLMSATDEDVAAPKWLHRLSHKCMSSSVNIQKMTKRRGSFKTQQFPRFSTVTMVLGTTGRLPTEENKIYRSSGSRSESKKYRAMMLMYNAGVKWPTWKSTDSVQDIAAGLQAQTFPVFLLSRLEKPASRFVALRALRDFFKLFTGPPVPPAAHFSSRSDTFFARCS